MQPDFELLLGSEPASPALDAMAQRLGAVAGQRLQQARDFELRLNAALAVAVPSDLSAWLSRIAQDATAADPLPAPSDDFELRLADALAVPMPESLLGDLLATPQRAQPRTSHWFRRSGPMALAASLLLVVGVATSWWLVRPGTLSEQASQSVIDPLLAAAVDHLRYEPFALTSTAKVPSTTVSGLLAQLGLALARPVEVNYAYPCPVGGQRTLHMVMQAETGPVTVFYFREAAAAEVEQFSHGGMLGRSLKYGDGMLVLIGNSSAEFDRVERVWRGALGA
jgi:hypothetical protein